MDSDSSGLLAPRGPHGQGQHDGALTVRALDTLDDLDRRIVVATIATMLANIVAPLQM